MNLIIFYLLILPISYLPYRLLYIVSNFLAFIFKNVIQYRKEVIYKNLKNSFPDKNNIEIKTLINKFYNHFSDLIIESFKGFTISKKQIIQRLQVENQHVIDKFKNQNIILIGGHYNNWEICGQGLPNYFDHELFAIYKPLKNSFFNEKMKVSREKFGLKMIPMKYTKRYFEKSARRPKAILFGSDQSPSNIKRAYWTKFLNQETAFLQGAEKYAVEFDWPVIYGSINKIKRGFYKVNYQIITEKPSNCSKGYIISKFAQLLEKDIKNKPEYWLWSHNRWKRKKI
tara:strand:- start:25655 stop:26509 length:855 start_codon:yes stop_codon:yes gene_type:complete